MKETVSFVAVADGATREIVRAVENASGGLTLILGHAKFYREDVFSLDEDAYAESRYSVHPTPHPDGNTIHRTLRTKKRIHHGYIWTEAIKKRTGFCTIFSSMCTDFKHGYESKPRKRAVLVGDFDTSQFSLCFTVLVSAPDVEFRILTPPPPNGTLNGEISPCAAFWIPYDFYWVDHAFSKFRLTFLVSYLNAPSTDAGHYFHTQTFRPEQSTHLNDFERRLMGHHISGHNAQFATLQWINLGRPSLLQKYVEERTIALGQPLDQNLMCFFAHPSRTSRAYADYIARVQLSELLNRVGAAGAK